MVQPDRVRQRLDALQNALVDLRRYRDTVSLDRLRSDPDARNMVLFALYVASQAAIDLALHAVADAELANPPTYREAFVELAGAGLLDADLARRLALWAGLRNVVAHHYPVLRLELVDAALRNDLRDLEEFAAVASSWME